MLSFIVSAIFFVIPLGALAYFITSLIGYCEIKNKSKKDPTLDLKEILRTRRIHLIVSAVMCGMFLVAVLSFVALLYMAVAYM